ncbi:MAG TPA: DUF6160 family protein [Noviherbaspirillum sp.]|nr:DUF6160 family protein [Noviherbaspirillum sp.]
MNTRRRSLPRAGMHALPCALALCLALTGMPAVAGGLQPLSDDALSAVRGRDGISFDLNNFSLSGDAKITYTAPTGATAYLSNIYLARSDDASNPFGDPYTLDVKKVSGLSDVIELMFPKNPAGIAKWQFAYDWGVDDSTKANNTNGFVFEGGSTVFKDVVFYGGGLQLFPSRSGSEGIGFGLGLRVDIGDILIRPRGRGDITNPDSSAEQMRFSNIRLGALDNNGNISSQPWTIADAEKQPGVIDAVTNTDPNVQATSRLHIGIDWPDLDRAPNGAALGGVEIGNISFGNGAGAVNLGASRIGSMQIQYLDIKFKP